MQLSDCWISRLIGSIARLILVGGMDQIRIWENRPALIFTKLPCRLTFAELRAQLSWEQRKVFLYNQYINQPRLTMWYGPKAYDYSGIHWPARKFPEILSGLCNEVNRVLDENYNAALCNLYRDGSDSVGWHSDNEPVFGKDPSVASLSYGATRRFILRQKKNHPEKRAFDLSDGDLLYMPSGIQKDWEHTIPKTKKQVGERINITFRSV